MTPSAQARAPALPAAKAAADRLDSAALALLLLCLAVRPFLAEMTFRTSSIPGEQTTGRALHAVTETARLIQDEPSPPHRLELARVTFAVGILACGGLWLLAGALRGEVRLRRGWLVAMVLVFAALALASALGASNRRYALDAWLEQVSLLLAAALAAQLCADRRRFVLVLVVLAVVAGTLAAKGLYERAAEIPDRVAMFEQNRPEWLAKLGWTDGSPEAIALGNRVRDTAVTGFGGLSNVLASVLLVGVMAAAGLAAWKVAAARAGRAEFRRTRKAGEIHLPSLAAAVAVLVALAAAVVLVLTRSRGGIIALVLAAGAGAAIWRFRLALAAHWRKALMALAVAGVLGAAAVVAWGVKHDSLPSKTLLFRWLYWKASAQIVRDHPLLGVGPANFACAYLQYREVRGEEAVKSPHNVVAQSLAEYGLPGGAWYLAILGAMVVAICRPGWHNFSSCAGQASDTDDAQAGKQTETKAETRTDAQAGKPVLPWLPWRTFVLLGAGLLLARSYFAGSAFSGGVWVFDALLPALVLAAMLAAGAWATQSGEFLRADDAAARIAVGCGLGGFLLYELVSFGLFAPAAAAMFYLAIGAMLGRGAAAPRVLRRGRWPIALAWWALVVAAAAVLWWPVYERTALTAQMEALHSPIATPRLAALAEAAAQADPLDPISAADAAEALCLPQAGRNVSAAPAAARAYQWALEAIRRDPCNPSWQRQAGLICRPLDLPAATEHIRQAVRLDPQDLRLRILLADMLLEASQPAAALRELDAAEAIDHGLLSDSSQRMTPAERQHVRDLSDRAQRSAR